MNILKMMMVKCLTVVLLMPALFVMKTSSGQASSIGIELSNNITALPVVAYPQLFHSRFNPGLDVYKSWKINSNQKNQFHWRASAGGYYHHMVHTDLRISASMFYLREVTGRFSADLGLGTGFGLAFEHMQTFRQEGDGSYSKVDFVMRPMYLALFTVGCRYGLVKNDPFSPMLTLHFRTFLQGPFVNHYVPLLPVNSLMIGVLLPVHKKNEK